MLKDLIVAPAIEYIIRHNGSSPALTFQQFLFDFIGKSKARSGTDHNQMILHDAGHGMLNGSLAFTGTKEAKKILNAENCLLNQVKDAQVITSSDHLDVFSSLIAAMRT